MARADGKGKMVRAKAAAADQVKPFKQAVAEIHAIRPPLTQNPHAVRDTKENLGRPEELSIVEVEDVHNASRRELVMSVPATAHDPLAVVEDAATGQRYLAAPGQRFKGSDGSEFVVSDVRPNQIVIENTATHATLTQPLRGPRG